MRPNKENVAEDIWLIMLFVLGFPALTISEPIEDTSEEN